MLKYGKLPANPRTRKSSPPKDIYEDFALSPTRGRRRTKETLGLGSDSGSNDSEFFPCQADTDYYIKHGYFPENSNKENHSATASSSSSLKAPEIQKNTTTAINTYPTPTKSILRKYSNVKSNNSKVTICHNSNRVDSISDKAVTPLPTLLTVRSFRTGEEIISKGEVQKKKFSSWYQNYKAKKNSNSTKNTQASSSSTKLDTKSPFPKLQEGESKFIPSTNKFEEDFPSAPSNRLSPKSETDKQRLQKQIDIYNEKRKSDKRRRKAVDSDTSEDALDHRNWAHDYPPKGWVPSKYPKGVGRPVDSDNNPIYSEESQIYSNSTEYYFDSTPNNTPRNTNTSTPREWPDLLDTSEEEEWCRTTNENLNKPLSNSNIVGSENLNTESNVGKFQFPDCIKTTTSDEEADSENSDGLIHFFRKLREESKVLQNGKIVNREEKTKK